jgi:hypothetical protein
LKRSTHLATVFDVVLKRRAAAAFAQAVVHNGADHLLSTFGREGALVWVFIRSPGESLTFGNISVPGPDRMDNLAAAVPHRNPGARRPIGFLTITIHPASAAACASRRRRGE